MELSFFTIKTEAGYYKGQWSFNPDPVKAKWYQKISTPRTLCTQYHIQFPNRPLPELVEAKVGEITFVQELKRVETSIAKREVRKLENEIRGIKWRIDREIGSSERAKSELLRLQAKLRLLENKG